MPMPMRRPATDMESPAISAKAKLSKKLCLDLPGHMQIRMSGIMKCFAASILLSIIMSDVEISKEEAVWRRK